MFLPDDRNCIGRKPSRYYFRVFDLIASFLRCIVSFLDKAMFIKDISDSAWVLFPTEDFLQTLLQENVL